MGTITEPPSAHLRYSELLEWLRENRVSKHKARILLSQGLIKPIYLGGGGAAYYNAEQIKRDVLNHFDKHLKEAGNG